MTATPPFVFLDFDGVLNTTSGVRAASLTGWRVGPGTTTRVEGSRAAPDPDCVARLDGILAISKAQVVVTSSWRTDKDVEALRSCLRDEFGLEHWEAVIGGTALPDRDTRAHQVSNYVERHGIRNYVILEDVETPFKRQRRHWIQVDPLTGLSDADVRRCLRVLGFPEPADTPTLNGS